ncbi:hypothetical protein K7X08_022994 [Anisodus acutangulus]|uniref:GH3 middle domain-containing protein n=1 Tax=Anisodus acutangulus TaxID=402998 RepID=A0A9Q1RHR0_9SOLA|nr:hypothetical protein K7X08_022994 [Anisodus acutangulus]
MSQYIATLDYYNNNFPLVSPMYTSSECPFGINLNPLFDVKIGQEYKVIVTTYAGLYRYRVGDVLRVSGYRNKAPQFNFIHLENVILSIDTNKTDEFEVQNAVKNATSNLMPFDARVTEYTSYAILPPFQAIMSYSGS